MSRSSVDGLAEAISNRLGTVEGVRETFAPDDPEPGIHAATEPSGRDRRAVRLSVGGSELKVTARLATDRAVPARAVISAAVAAIDDVLGSRPYALELEIAVID